MSFGSDSPGGSPEGIGGNEAGIGDSSGGAGGGFGGYSQAEMDAAMAASDAQAAQNNAENALASIGYGSGEIGNIMNNMNNLSVSEQTRAQEALADIAIKQDFKERGFIDKLSTLYTAYKVNADLGLYGETIGENLAESMLGFTSGKIASVLAGPFGKKIGGMLASYAANKTRDDFIDNVSKFGLDRAKDLAREQQSLHTQQYGYSGDPQEIIEEVNKSIIFQGGNPMGFWEDITGESSASAATGAAATQANYQQKALDFLKSRDVVPRVFSEGATKRLGGFYGLAGGEQGVMDKYRESPIYENLRFGREMGEDAIMRNAAQTGGLRSGNTQEALYGYNAQLENQGLNQYLAGLGGFTGLSGYAPQIASGMQGIGSTLAQGQLGAAQAEQAGTGNLLGLAGSIYQGLGGYQGIGDLAGTAWDYGSSAVSTIGSAIGSLF